MGETKQEEKEELQRDWEQDRSSEKMRDEMGAIIARKINSICPATGSHSDRKHGLGCYLG